MAQRTCSIEGCNNKHLARGYCGTHYNKTFLSPERRHPKVEVQCATCGGVVRKHVDKRRPNRFCSYACRDSWRARNAREMFPSSPAEDRRALRRIADTLGSARAAAPQASGRPCSAARFVGADCAWCDSPFLWDRKVSGVPARYCSKRCSKASQRQRYLATRGQFSVTRRQRLGIYERDGWVCQLCGDPVAQDLDPLDDWAPSLDHIECQSWALVPDHSIENLRLAHRWCNSVRSDESHYGAEALLPA